MKDAKKPDYEALIPAFIRFDNELPMGAKILYGEIFCYINYNIDQVNYRHINYCSEKTSYFASLYEVSESTINRWLKLLNKKNYIKIEYICSVVGTLMERRFYIGDF